MCTALYHYYIADTGAPSPYTPVPAAMCRTTGDGALVWESSMKEVGDASILGCVQLVKGGWLGTKGMGAELCGEF
jgi:hypothetical protein